MEANNQFITMQEILDRLNEFKINTDVDIKADWIEEKERQTFTRQSTQLAMAIGILTTLGKNNNF